MLALSDCSLFLCSTELRGSLVVGLTVSYALDCYVLGYVDAILDGFNCVGTKTIPDKDTISSHIRTMISTRFLQRSQTAPHRSLKVTDSHIS